MKADILAPAAVLVVWTLIMLLWLMFTRLPALKAAGIDIAKVVGGRGQDLEGVLPANTNWKAHNYAHLVEQPTLFYATIGILAIMGQVSQAAIWLAWAYVALRIAHSVVQFTQAAQHVLLVVCDEPASMTDAYALVKVLSRNHEVS